MYLFLFVHVFLVITIMIYVKHYSEQWILLFPFRTSNGSGGAVNGHNKVLDAPLQMSQMAEGLVQEEDTSIWLVKRDNSSVGTRLF